MLSVAEGQKIVLENVRPLAPELTALSPQALGLILAEDVASDLDMPPFDKAMMDGFALRTQDLHAGSAELSIIEQITAGKTPVLPVSAGQATQIMTGAPMPRGADAVVMIERCELLPSERVRICDPQLQPGRNMLPRGSEMRAGDVVLHIGTRLRPQEFGLLAAVGRAEVKLHPAAQVAILSTGDELVEPIVKPGPGQIRNSNGPMLQAQVCRAGGVPHYLGIAGDEPMTLRARIAEGLQADVLLLSGGVSAGKLDLVPGTLADLGVSVRFHRVSMKPGKPMLFGVLPREDASRPPRLIFGLPGNPVSALVCFELFVRPALRGLRGLPPGPDWVKATLAKDYHYATDRPTYHPAYLQRDASGWSVEAMPWSGSADLRSVGQANAFVLLPAGDFQYRAGDSLEVLCVENGENDQGMMPEMKTTGR